MARYTTITTPKGDKFKVADCTTAEEIACDTPDCKATVAATSPELAKWSSKTTASAVGKAILNTMIVQQGGKTVFACPDCSKK